MATQERQVRLPDGREPRSLRSPSGRLIAKRRRELSGASAGKHAFRTVVPALGTLLECLRCG